MITYTKIRTFIAETAMYFMMIIAVLLMGKGGGQ